MSPRSPKLDTSTADVLPDDRMDGVDAEPVIVGRPTPLGQVMRNANASPEATQVMPDWQTRAVLAEQKLDAKTRESLARQYQLEDLARKVTDQHAAIEVLMQLVTMHGGPFPLTRGGSLALVKSQLDGRDAMVWRLTRFDGSVLGEWTEPITAVLEYQRHLQRIAQAEGGEHG